MDYLYLLKKIYYYCLLLLGTRRAIYRYCYQWGYCGIFRCMMYDNISNEITESFEKQPQLSITISLSSNLHYCTYNPIFQ